MGSGAQTQKYQRILQRSRRSSMFVPSISVFVSLIIILYLAKHVHVASVIGTTAAATIAACATYTRSYFRTQRYVRFAIRARLNTKAEPDFDKLTRSYRSLNKYVQQSAHPSPEIQDALREAEKRMGMRAGSVLALVVPLELILGVPHNCPAAAAMLYANRHPVILIDDHLQILLDTPQDYERSYKIVVSVMCHELAHLVGWNTRWPRLVNIGDLFATTAAMASLVAYGLEHTFIYGIIGAFIAAIYLASEPALENEGGQGTPMAIAARLALVTWVPFVVAGMAIGALPIGLTIGVTILAFGLRFIISACRRKQELYADSMAALAVGSSDPLTDFFRTFSHVPNNIWTELFATHPPMSVRIKNLRNLKI